MTQSDDRAPPIRWDHSRREDLSSSLVAARDTDDHVVIDFGDCVSTQAGDAELSPRLKRRIALPPVTAKRLCDMLARLTAEGGVSIDGSG